jgi:hypothetical protein
MRSLPAAAMALTVGCAPYPPIPPGDPCVSEKLTCNTVPTDPGFTFCGYTATNDAGDERVVGCPRQAYYFAADGGKHYLKP